ncbi:MAG: ArsR family transcriptional regulator [Clostridia bacterium]|nr:ArsR family transcriptional regulator [Clostridia bacterium]
MERDYKLLIDEEDKMADVIYALNAQARRNIMSLLRSSSYSVVELARLLKLPISTVSFHLNILSKAGLVSVVVKKNTRGNAKIVSRNVDHILLDFISDEEDVKSGHFSQEIPLGSFSDAQVRASCGMANENSIIIADDLPGVFFSPERYGAQIIWFSKGYLEYKIPNYMIKDKKLNSITFSMELCSEAPNYRNDWESDITFWINGVEVATYVSPGDFGGRRGRLNPDWWSDYSTQYGIIKNLSITEKAVFLDENRVSTRNIQSLGIQGGDYITFRIGIKDNARHQGGINLFGEKFGDFSQGLVFMADYS